MGGKGRGLKTKQNKFKLRSLSGFPPKYSLDLLRLLKKYQVYYKYPGSVSFLYICICYRNIHILDPPGPSPTREWIGYDGQLPAFLGMARKPSVDRKAKSKTIKCGKSLVPSFSYRSYRPWSTALSQIIWEVAVSFCCEKCPLMGSQGLLR